MEEIKNLFIKHFGFYPDIISTTEHAYISPPSRIISSLMELSKFSGKKILKNIKSVDSVIIYNNIIKMYVYNLQLDFLYKWLEETDSFSINSIEVRTFLKETLD